MFANRRVYTDKLDIKSFRTRRTNAVGFMDLGQFSFLTQSFSVDFSPLIKIIIKCPLAVIIESLYKSNWMSVRKNLANR